MSTVDYLCWPSVLNPHLSDSSRLTLWFLFSLALITSLFLSLSLRSLHFSTLSSLIIPSHSVHIPPFIPFIIGVAFPRYNYFFQFAHYARNADLRATSDTQKEMICHFLHLVMCKSGAEVSMNYHMIGSITGISLCPSFPSFHSWPHWERERDECWVGVSRRTNTQQERGSEKWRLIVLDSPPDRITNQQKTQKKNRWNAPSGADSETDRANSFH